MNGKLLAAVAGLVLAVVLAGWWWLDAGVSREGVAGQGAAASSAGEVELEPRGTSAVDARAVIEPPTPPESAATPEEREQSPDEGARVVVVVVDVEGAPLAGATVEITGEGPLGTHTADVAGRCPLPILAGEGMVGLRVEAEGFVPYCVQNSRNTEIRLALARAVQVRGQVVEARDGAPIAGAKVEIVRVGCSADAPHATTDTAGRFELDGAPLDQAVDWVVEAQGFVTRARKLELRDEGVEVVLELERGVELELEVVDALSGVALAGARVRGGEAELLSDARGRLSTSALLAVDEQEARLRVDAEGYCTLHAVLRQGEVSSARPVRLPLLEGARLEGVVRDSRGAPLPDVPVRIDYDWGRSFRRREGEAPPAVYAELPAGWSHVGDRQPQGERTDPSGRFAIDGLQPGVGSYRALVVAPQIDPSYERIEALGPPGSTTWIELVARPLPLGATVLGTLMLNGVPTSGSLRWRGPTRDGWCQVGEDGRFRLDRVENGSVGIEPQPARTSWFGTCALIRDQRWSLEVPSAGEAALDIDVRIPVGTIGGRVLGVDGSPAAGIEVEAWSHDACLFGAGRTDEEGRFEVDVGRDVASYRVQAGQGVDRVAREGVAPGTGDLELVLPGLAVLRLRVVDPATGKALDRFSLVFTRDDGEQEQLFTNSSMGGPDLAPDPRGWYEVGLRPGRYRLVVSDPINDTTGYRPVVVDGIVVAADQDAPGLEIERPRGLELELQLAEGLAPWSREEFRVVLVEAARQDETGGGQGASSTDIVRLDARGRARQIGLAPGPYRFEVFPPRMAIEPAEVVVTGAERAPLTIRWARK